MKFALAAMTALLFLAGPGVAEDISWVTIQNEYQADLAAGVVDHPYTRVGNRFVAGLTLQQRMVLEGSGIAVEVIWPDTDPADVYRVMPDGRAELRRPELQALGLTVDLAGDMVLLQAEPTSASSLIDEPGYLVRSLEELSVRWLYLPTAIATDLSSLQSFPTDTLVDLISQDSIYAFNQRLMEFETRYIWSDSIDAARDWMMQKFTEWGYTDVTMQAFPYGGGTHYNVVVVKPGYAEPDRTIVVGGHYDSINFDSDPMVYAPGADDNGSGTAATMEMARVLADVPVRKTIVFMPFSAEEVGLVGSAYAAAQFVAAGTDVEAMYNYDMIGYDPSNAREISVAGAQFNTAYRDVTVAAAGRVTDLIPVPNTSPGGSDHQSFADQGIPISHQIEANFNFDGWHTNLDLTSRLNYPYMTKVVKMGLASLLVTANSSSPTNIDRLVDMGDGQSLRVTWDNCDPTYTYTAYLGTSSGNYTDSVIVPSGECSWTFTGLTEGIPYFIAVSGVAPGAYPPIYTVEDSLTPLVIPRVPSQFHALSELNRIDLDWRSNPEADLSHYRLYRQVEGGGWTLYQDNLTDTTFSDIGVAGQTLYGYQVTAVDLDANESDPSAEVATYAATFDGGLLVVDEITQGNNVPTQEEQEALFDTLFGETPYAMTQVEELQSVLHRDIAGQYNSIYWFDDDLARKNIGLSNDTLRWYLDHTTNMLVGGLRTVQYWAGSFVEPGELEYDEFGLDGYTDNSAFDFAGAFGQNGWPALQVDPDNIFGNLPDIPSLQATPDATVIYTYDAASDDPSREGQPVGLLKQTSKGYRVLLAFPITFLTTESATTLIDRVKVLFEGGTVVLNGDVDLSGAINVADLTYLVAYLFQGGPPPLVPNSGDVDQSCTINVADLTYLVNYLFKGGPEPLAGCVE